MTGIQVTKRTLKTANTDRNKAASPNLALPKRSLNKTYKRKTHGFNSLAPLLWRAGVLAPVATGILARRPVPGAEVLGAEQCQSAPMRWCLLDTRDGCSWSCGEQLVPQPSPCWHPREHRQGQLPNEPTREGGSAPLAVHLPKEKVAHPHLDTSVFFLHAPFRKTSGKFDIKTRRLSGAGQREERKQRVYLPAWDVTGPGLELTPEEHCGGEQAQSVPPGCPPSLSHRAPWPAREHHCPCLPRHARSAGLLSPCPRRQRAQQQPRSPEPSCSPTNETAERDLKALACQREKGWREETREASGPSGESLQMGLVWGLHLFSTTEPQRIQWILWALGTAFSCHRLQTRRASGLRLTGLCWGGRSPRQCQLSLPFAYPEPGRQVCRAAVLAGLLPAPTTSQPSLAGAAALPLCIIGENVPKATYSSFATWGRRVAPAGQAAGTGRLKHPRLGVGGQLARLQICLPLRLAQLGETEPDCGKQEQIGRSGSSRVVFLAERAAQLQLSWHAGRAAE